MKISSWYQNNIMKISSWYQNNMYIPAQFMTTNALFQILQKIAITVTTIEISIKTSTAKAYFSIPQNVDPSTSTGIVFMSIYSN
jgi:hypothetical protein